MTELVLKQKHHNGIVRSWRLKPQKKIYSFGSSKFADLISIDSHVPGIAGTFHYVNHRWEYIPMQMSHINEEKIVIESFCKIEFKNFHMDATPILKSDNLINKISQHNSESGYLLAIAHHEGRILKTKLIKETEKSKKHFENTYQNVTYKKIPISDLANYKNNFHKNMFNQEDKKPLMILGFFVFFVSLLGILTPKNDVASLATITKETSKIALLPQKLKLQKKELSQVSRQQVRQPSSAAPSSADNSPTKNIVTGKLTQLIGKVAARVGSTKNIVVTTGSSAANENTSAAMAAIGKLKNQNAQWGDHVKGSSVVISTQGTGGGRGVAGLGTLKSSGTGSAGIGLIEDESEIVGGLDRDVIAQYIKTQLGQILYCYERQLSAHPELFGKVSVKFTIGPSGKVEKQLIGDSTLKSSTVEGCILNKIAGWQFPAPQGGTSVLVTYPFLFKSTN